MRDIVARARAIVLTPQTEWSAVAREPPQTTLVIRYIAVLALLPALSRFVGLSLTGGYVPVVAGLIGAAVGYALSFAVVYLVAFAVHALAPTFGGDKNFPDALKLAAYSYTPVWLAGVFLMVPGLSFLGVLGLYGAYLMWSGLPVLTKSPPPRVLPYAATVAAWAVVLEVAARAVVMVLIDLGR
jgi:Yip1-like protein